MQERAEQVAATRQRIVDATVRLHTTVGPSRTTVSAIAEQAGVTRLTVYRHFPDREALFEACTAQWAREHPPPDPAAWRAIRDVETRAYRGLRELYGWYGEHGLALLALYRDPEVMPESVRQGSRDQFNQFAEALVTGSGIRGHARRRLRAAAGHAVDIRTWYSLAGEQELPTDEAADLAGSLLVAAVDRRSRSAGS